MAVTKIANMMKKALVTGVFFGVFALLASPAFAVEAFTLPYPVYNAGATDVKTVVGGITEVEFGTFGGAPIIWDVFAAPSAEATTQVLLRTKSAVTLPPLVQPAKWNNSALRLWLNGVGGTQFASSTNFTSADYKALVPDTRTFDGVNSVDRFVVTGFSSTDTYTSIQVEALVDLRLLEFVTLDDTVTPKTDPYYRTMGTTSPHGGYTSTTSKCASCHSVHSAYTESAVMGGDTPSMLLATSVADACTYCHIDANARSDVKIYGGVASNYNTMPSADSTVVAGAHRSNMVGDVQQGGVSCSDCHTVHGSSAGMTGNTYLDASILRVKYPDTMPALTATDTPDTALSKWCVQCHTVASADKPHMNLSSTASGMEVAWQDVTGCTSCHAAGTETSDFPHYTAGAASFLLSATSADAIPTGALSATEDGVCLRCHRETDASGVGVEF